jgi:transcriptional regulator with XRE-family HTH domain
MSIDNLQSIQKISGLREERKRRKLTLQQASAQMTDISFGYLGQIERGEVYPDELREKEILRWMQNTPGTPSGLPSAGFSAKHPDWPQIKSYALPSQHQTQGAPLTEDSKLQIIIDEWPVLPNRIKRKMVSLAMDYEEEEEE